MSSFIERLAGRVVSLEKKVNRALTSPQLGNSSLEDGTLEEYDGDGQLVTIIGKQPDGTHGAVVVSGPVPPRPSAPAVAPGPGLLSYGWDGNFADETTGETDITIPAPMDFGRVEAHASKFQGFAADTAATLLDTMESPRGGSRTVMLEPGTWFVKLVTRALSGKRSAESLEVSVEVLPPSSGDVDVDALRDEFQAADAQLNEALGQLAVSKIGLDRLDAEGQLTTVVADQVFSDLFATRKLYANQVVVGHPGNLHPDPGFNDSGFLARMAANSTCHVTLGASGDLQLTNTDPNGALQLFRPMGTAPTREGVLANGWTAVSPGDVWTFTMTVSSWQGTTGGIRFLGRNADGSTEVLVPEYETLDWPTGKYTLEATIPTGCRWIIPEVLVAQGVSYINQGTVEFRQKITPSLIVDGFFQGLRVIGASVETNAAVSRGVKINDSGLFAYDPSGAETLRLDGQNNILTGATIRTAASGARVQMSTNGLEAWGADNVQYLKADAAGIELTGSIAARGLTAESTPRPIAIRMTTVTRNVLGAPTVINPGLVFDDYNGTLTQKPGIYSPTGKELHLFANQDLLSGNGRLELSVTEAHLVSNRVRVGQHSSIGQTTEIRLEAVTVNVLGNTVNIGRYPTTPVNIDGTLKINGATPITDQSAITRSRITLTNGYTHWTGGNWNGLWLEQLGKMVIITGAVGNASAWSAGSLIANISSAFRPANKVQGVNCELQADGRLQMGGAGATAQAMSLTYFLP